MSEKEEEEIEEEEEEEDEEDWEEEEDQFRLICLKLVSHQSSFSRENLQTGC